MASEGAAEGHPATVDSRVITEPHPRRCCRNVQLLQDSGAQTLQSGMCAGFPAGTGDAHRFVNRSARDVRLLVIGDRTPGDVITYPDVDMHATLDRHGKYAYTRKDGTPY